MRYIEIGVPALIAIAILAWIVLEVSSIAGWSFVYDKLNKNKEKK